MTPQKCEHQVRDPEDGRLRCVHSGNECPNPPDEVAWPCLKGYPGKQYDAGEQFSGYETPSLRTQAQRDAWIAADMARISDEAAREAGEL